MPQPKTLKELLIAEGVTTQELNNLAEQIFTSDREFNAFGYLINLPDFQGLPNHVQGFIRKAILESSIMTVLDKPKKSKKKSNEKISEEEKDSFLEDNHPFGSST